MVTKSSPWIRANYRLILAGIFLLATLLRVYGLNTQSPPGLEHDEVAHWLINREILAGNHALYFSEAYGHEAGFHYFQTLFMVLLGDNAFALRLPSAVAGLLLVAVSFALARRLFRLEQALLAAALLAVLFWPVFYSRLALRAISLPLLSGLSAYLWWKAWQLGARAMPTKTKGRVTDDPTLWFLLAGIVAGLSLYSYLASRVVPIFYLLFSLYLFLFQRIAFKKRFRGISLFFLSYLVVAAPLVIYLLSNPGAEARISEVDAPLLALVRGDLKPVLENSLRFIAMFGFRGDPLWRQNVAFLPVFEPVIAVFFYIGLLISIWRWRQPAYLFIILWLFTAAIPSIVTIDAPSSIRIINALPVLGLFPVIGVEVIHFYSRLSTIPTWLSPKNRRLAAVILAFLVIGIYSARTYRHLFETWIGDQEVQFVWQQALTNAAEFLDSSPENGPVAVGGWTPDTKDPPTMELTLKREDLALRYFDPGSSLIIPAPTADQGGARIVQPTILPLGAALADQLAKWDIQPELLDDFTSYELDQKPMIDPQAPDEVTFGGQITYLGFDLVQPEQPSGAINLLTFWRVETPGNEPRRFFLHLVDQGGEVLGQADQLGAPAEHWQAGDLIVQNLVIDPLADEDSYSLRLGIYNPETNQRLLTPDGDEYIILPLPSGQ